MFHHLRTTLALTLTCSSQAAYELPARDHLLFWTDASEQAGVREAASLPRLNSGQGVDVLLDAVGKHRDFLQPLADCRPTLVTDGKFAFLRFDGRDDFLFLKNQGEMTPEMTLFVLAAPKANPGLFSGIFASAAANGNDYTFGLNLDLGDQPTEMLSCVNVESAGTGGMKNLLDPSSEKPFGSGANRARLT